MLQNILKHPQKEHGAKCSLNFWFSNINHIGEIWFKRKWGNVYLNQLDKYKPKKFLEIGVFCGVTARNTCDYLNLVHGDKFKYVGIDLFDKKHLKMK